VTVLDLGEGPRRCPSCAAELEEVPDADMEAEGPPPAPPLPTSSVEAAAWDRQQASPPDESESADPLSGPSLTGLRPPWQSVVRGLHLVRLGQLLFFVGWGLLVMAAVALIIFAMIDAERAANLLGSLALFCSSTAVAVCSVLVAGRLCCCKFDEKQSSGRTLAWFSAGATLLAALLWLALLVLALPSFADAVGRTGLFLGWLVALVASGLAEAMFLLFIRAVGRCLYDRPAQEQARWFLTGPGLFLGLALLAVVVAPVGLLLVGGLGARMPLLIGLLLLAAVVVAGVGVPALVSRYLGALAAARLAIGQRRTALAVTTPG
jgi:hypothetical protein